MSNEPATRTAPAVDDGESIALMEPMLLAQGSEAPRLHDGRAMSCPAEKLQGCALYHANGIVLRVNPPM